MPIFNYNLSASGGLRHPDLQTPSQNHGHFYIQNYASVFLYMYTNALLHVLLRPLCYLHFLLGFRTAVVATAVAAVAVVAAVVVVVAALSCCNSRSKCCRSCMLLQQLLLNCLLQLWLQL